MQKHISMLKVEPLIYKLDKYSDDSMFTLYMCLTDGLGVESYVNFLEDCERVTFSGNICSMIKLGEMVSLAVDEGIIPSLPVFKTSIDNLIILFKELKRLQAFSVESIRIVFDGNMLTITGD